MNHEHEQSRTSLPAATETADQPLEPGQSSRSALLRKPPQPIPSGLVQRKAPDPNGVAVRALAAAPSNDINGTPDVPETKVSGYAGPYYYAEGGGAVEGEDDSFADDCSRNTFFELFTRKDRFMLGGFVYGVAQTYVPGGELAPSPSAFFPEHELAPWFDIGRGGGITFGGEMKIAFGTGGTYVGGGMASTGTGAPVGVPVLAASAAVAVSGTLDLALGMSVAAAAMQKAGQQSSSSFDKRFREGERRFMRPEDRIDMRAAPSGSPVNLPGGYPRNARWYFKQLLEKRPRVFSEDNKKRIADGLSPIVDKVWLKYHPEHEHFIGDFLRHHHIDRGPIAVAIPRRFHEIFHSMLHHVD